VCSALQVDLIIHSYSYRYGTFLGNSAQEREELKLNDNTESLWGILNVNNTLYVNHLYDQLEKVSDIKYNCCKGQLMS